jgi:flagellar assembly protein FliH
MTARDPSGFRPVPPPRRIPLSALATRRVSATTVFDEDFAGPRRARVEPAPEPEVIVPSYSAAELEEARRAAFREGQDAGRTAATQEADAQGRAALASLARALGPAMEDARATQQAAAEGAARLVLGALMALHPALSQTLAQADIMAMAQALLPALADEPRLTVHLAPAMATALREQLEQAAATAHFAGRLDVRADDAMAGDAATLTWSGGDANRDPARARAALLDALGPLGLAPVVPEPPATPLHVMDAEA